jgi:rhamnosyltransferase
MSIKTKISKDMDVAILTVTYNPCLDTFLNNLRSYQSQVKTVIIVDNSTNNEIRDQIIALSNKFNNLVVITNYDNLGIAKAQNIGIKYIKDNNFEFLIEMDQDSSLNPTYVNQILISYQKLSNKNKNIACLGPIAINSKTGEVYDGYLKDIGIINVDKTLSSGLLIKCTTLEIIGRKNEDLFIDLVDWDWCWRAKKLGYLTFVDTSLNILHELGDKHLRFFSLRIGIPSSIRHYYAFRNSLYLMNKEFVPFTWKVKTSFLLLMKLIIYPIILPSGLIRIKYMLRGINDYFLSKFGPYVKG